MSFISGSMTAGRYGIREVAECFHLIQKVDMDGERGRGREGWERKEERGEWRGREERGGEGD